MIYHLAIHGFGQAVNRLLSQDPTITNSIKSQLSGKMLRVVCKEPNISIDVYFHSAGKLYLEQTPTIESKEAIDAQIQGAINVNKPLYPADCTLTLAHAVEVIKLLNDETGTLPISGDYKVLYNIKNILLLSDITSSIEALLHPLLGASLSGQITNAMYAAKQQTSQNLSQAQFLISEWLEDSKVIAPRWQFNQLKTNLRNFNTELERSHARIDAITKQVSPLKASAASALKTRKINEAQN